MATDVTSRIEAEADTELDRLGSQKYLLAVTEASLEPGPVLAAAVDERHHARITYERWAADESVEAANQAFTAAAGREREARGRIAAELQSVGVTHAPPEDPNALQAHLRSIDDTVDRIGAGLFGALFVTDRAILQYVNFFINEGDSRRADMFRDIRTELSQGVDTGTWIVAERLDDGAADRVVEAAVGAISAAYEEYAETLADMGMDPKPLC